MKRWKSIFCVAVCAAVCPVVYLAVCVTGLMGGMRGGVNEKGNGTGTDKTLISSSGIEDESGLPEPEEMIAILEKCCKDLYQNALEEEGTYIPIPAAEFESAIWSCFHIGSETLREKTRYCQADETYQYRPRSFYDNRGETEIPYPEVTACQKQEDGTIELTVNAVWPEQNLCTAFCHTVVVNSLPDP